MAAFIRAARVAVLITVLLPLTGCRDDPLKVDSPLNSPLADHKPPVVNITSPADGDTLSGLFVIAADATDKYGVDSVEFFIDGIKVADGTDTTEPFEYRWDTRSVASGSDYSLTARATDPSGNSAISDPIAVTVVNHPGPGDANVIVLFIDGARYTETFGDPDHTYVPYMWNELRPQGTMFSNFRNEGITRTVPGHSSVETGTWQYLANDGSERPDRPTFFEYLRLTHAIEQNQTWVVAGKAKLEACTYSTYAGYGAAYSAAGDAVDRDDSATFQALIGHLQSDHPRLVMVNFATVDRAGHSGIWNDYVGAIQVADSLTRELWHFIDSDPFYMGRTYLFITNDHGRHTTDFTSHGDDCEGCQHLMCLVLGPDIRPDYTITGTHTMLELCPTIGTIFDFSTPYAAGAPLADIFVTSTTGIAGLSR